MIQDLFHTAWLPVIISHQTDKGWAGLVDWLHTKMVYHEQLSIFWASCKVILLICIVHSPLSQTASTMTRKWNAYLSCSLVRRGQFSRNGTVIAFWASTNCLVSSASGSSSHRYGSTIYVKHTMYVETIATSVIYGSNTDKNDYQSVILMWAQRCLTPTSIVSFELMYCPYMQKPKDGKDEVWL